MCDKHIIKSLNTIDLSAQNKIDYFIKSASSNKLNNLILFLQNTFSIDMTAHHYNDWDGTDELLITYSVDSGSYSNLMAVQMVTEGSGSATNEPAALDTDFDGAGDCGADTTLPALSTGTGSQSCAVSSSNFKTFTTSSISLSSNLTLDIKLQFNSLTANDEGIYLDNITITHNSIAGLTSSDNYTVPSHGTVTTTADISTNNLTVSSGGSLTIAKENSVNVTGNFSNSGTVTMNSDSNEYSILIVDGTSSGDIKYNLYVNDYDDGWDLKGSPVGDGSSNGSVTGTDFESTTISSTVYYALQAYNNSNSSWTANSTSGSQTLTPAKGYSAATDNSSNGDTVLFTGPLDDDNVTIAITESVSGSGDQWNLVANPYPSYLALNALATAASDATTNFLTYNATTQNRQGPATVHERIKTEVQGQMFNSINKMQISTALYRLVELARIKYYEEHKEEDPECTGFDVQEFLKVEEKDLNFKDLHGRAKPLFDHDSLEISKSGLGTYKTCPYKYKLEKIQRTPTAGSAIALDLGNSVHNTIDALVKEKPGEIPTKEELHAKLEEEWIFQSFPSKATSNATKQRAQTMLENYEGWQKTTKNTVVATEKEFRFD